MSDKPLQLERVCRSFGAVEVLREISLNIRRGEFVAVVGPSGCGKTTLLNLLSGYDHPSSGVIRRKGRIRMVYQQDGLFPWQTVMENIELGLRHIGDQKERVAASERNAESDQARRVRESLPSSAFRRDATARRTGASAGRRFGYSVTG